MAKETQDDTWQQADWWGMPEYVQRDIQPWKSIKVHFEQQEDMDNFAKLVDQRVPGRGPGGSIWYPEALIGHFRDKRYVESA